MLSARVYTWTIILCGTEWSFHSLKLGPLFYTKLLLRCIVIEPWLLGSYLTAYFKPYMTYESIQINHQPDATIFQFIILTFIYRSTCFGNSPAHQQELNGCSSSLLFYLRIVVIVVLCSWSGRLTCPTTNTARLSPRYEGKTRGCYCCHWALDDGRENARNMLSCK